MVWFGLVWFGFARGLAVVFDLVRFGSGELSYIQNHDVLILMCIYPIHLLSSVLYVRANMFCIKISPISFGNRQKLSCLYAYICTLLAMQLTIWVTVVLPSDAVLVWFGL